MNVNLNTIHQANIPAMPVETAQVEQQRQTEKPAALSITQAPVLSPKRLCLTTKFGSRHYKGVCDERLA